jgi:hypothetical protein
MGLENKFIKCKSVEHGARIIEYLKRYAENVCCYNGSAAGSYYGIVGGIICDYAALPKNATEITLPDEWTPKFGEEVWVSNESIEDAINKKKKRIFLAEIKQSLDPFICVFSSCEESFKRGEKVPICACRFIAKIEEPQIIELTFEDISNGKGVGVDPKLIRIKE